MSKYTSINILHLARENFSPGEYFQLYSIMPFQMCVCGGGGGEGGYKVKFILHNYIPVFSLQAKSGAPATGPRLRPRAHRA